MRPILPVALLVFSFLAFIGTPTTTHAEEGLVTYKALTPENAMKAAMAAMHACRASGYQVAVVVTTREGTMQAAVRDRYAGTHTTETARRKAWTAVSFRTNTVELTEATKEGTPQSGIRQLPNVGMIGGGVMIEAGGVLVGGIGVSGAPGEAADGTNIDQTCAKAGIEAIADALF